MAVGAFWFVENYPDTAKFITEKERVFIKERLASDSDATLQEEFSWTAVMDALKDVKCWLYGLGFHSTSLPLYTFSLFLVRSPCSWFVLLVLGKAPRTLAIRGGQSANTPPPQPTIIKNLGYTAAIAQLLTIPPYAFAFITTLGTAIISERVGRRAPFIIGSALFGIIGYAILLGNSDPVRRPGVSYVGTFFAAGGIFPAVALVLSWPAINVSGQTKRAVSNAMQISIGNLGAVLGTQLYRANDGPRYIVGHAFALGYLALTMVVAGTLWFILKRENERREGVAEEVKNIGDLEDWIGDTDPRWRFQY